MTVRVAPLTGNDMAPALDALARLRIAVFRDWPYLYDGTLEYERKYLAKLAAAQGAVIVAAYDGETIVGCATGAPMAEVEAEFAAPFEARGLDIRRIFHCGESVRRSRGVGGGRPGGLAGGGLGCAARSTRRALPRARQRARCATPPTGRCSRAPPLLAQHVEVVPLT